MFHWGGGAATEQELSVLSPGVSAAPLASQPSSARVLTDAVLQTQRDTINAINEVTKELQWDRHGLVSAGDSL